VRYREIIQQKLFRTQKNASLSNHKHIIIAPPPFGILFFPCLFFQTSALKGLWSSSTKYDRRKLTLSCTLLFRIIWKQYTRAVGYILSHLPLWNIFRAPFLIMNSELIDIITFMFVYEFYL